MERRDGIAKRRRTRFDSWQIQKLEQLFLKTHYPDTKQIEVLALKTNIPEHKMQIWFQNRRAKWRKSSKLRNFGGLERLKETEYVPAPNTDNTIKQFYNYLPKQESSAENAIDLRKICLNGCESIARMSEIYDKSSVYKHSGGITSIGPNDHINRFEFEYPTAYYGRHSLTEEMEKTPAIASFALASNQSYDFAIVCQTHQRYAFKR